jgi:SAM-dependent methyltransferase
MTVDFRNSEAALASGERIGFSFGKNWARFLADLDAPQIEQAARSLSDAFGDFNLAGERFIDVGCGSGVFSLSALRAGASEVVSIDIDPQSIACAKALRQFAATPENWTIVRGSVLDPEFVASIEPASRVYSWGVLHHTGSVWKAIESAMSLVPPAGVLCLGLYNRPSRAELHMSLKRTYNRLPSGLQPLLSLAYASALLGGLAVLRRRNPVKYVRDYGRRSRGMSFWRDVEDWLGGLPCEFVDESDICAFATARGFTVERVVRRSPGANNEYLIRRVTGSMEQRAI